MIIGFIIWSMAAVLFVRIGMIVMMVVYLKIEGKYKKHG